MGPLSRDHENGGRRMIANDGGVWNIGAEQHAKCREGTRCQGPGCRTHTGKTARKRARRQAYFAHKVND